MRNAAAFYVTILLVAGSIDMIVQKLAYQTDSIDIDGYYKQYNPPMWFAWLGVCGKAMLLPVFLIQRAIVLKTSKDPQQIQSFKFPKNNMKNGIFILKIAFLGLCDVVLLTFNSIAILNCPVSITQILRGFIIVFVMITSRIILKRVPQRNQVLGVVLAFVGVILVGLSAVLSGNNNGTSTGILIGILLTLAAQVFCSIQYAMEERLMKETGINNLFLAGFEGWIGITILSVLVLPVSQAIHGKDHGSFEYIPNSIFMMFSKAAPCAFSIVFWITLGMYGFSTLGVTKTLSGTHRTLIEALRTCIIWAVMVILYYCTKGSKPAHNNMPYGEKITYWSILQLFGFAFMIFGTFVHNDANLGSKVLKALFCMNNGPVQWCEVKQKASIDDTLVQSKAEVVVADE